MVWRVAAGGRAVWRWRSALVAAWAAGGVCVGVAAYQMRLDEAVGWSSLFPRNDALASLERRLAGAAGNARRWCPPGALASTQVYCDAALAEESELVPNLSYPNKLDANRQLVGIGMRRMTPLKVKVYAIGLYMSTDDIASQLRAWRGHSVQSIEADTDLWRVMCSPELSKTIVMIMARNVSGKHIQQGFDRAMLRRVKGLAVEGEGGGKDALRVVNRAIGARQFVVGEQIRFEFGPGGEFAAVFPDGQRVGVRNRALSLAFAEMFIGERAASPEAKHAFAVGLEERLA